MDKFFGGDLVRCSRCGFENEASNKFCMNCGASLIVQPEINNYSQFNRQIPSKNNNNLLIVSITVIVIGAMLAGTFFYLNYFNGFDLFGINSVNEPATADIDVNVNVNTATFYLDGNPNSGIPATINVGKEFSGESMEIMTTYSRDGSNLNNPSSFETHEVDVDGNIVITEYAPIPRYPDYCSIDIRYKNQTFQYGCDMVKGKGSQTRVPVKK